MISPNETWVMVTYAKAVPEQRYETASAWAARFLRLPGSARSEQYSPEITPWTREPLDRACSGKVKTLTFVKPVQSGGSVIGEACACFYIATESGGDIQYNWKDDNAATERWDKRIEKILKANSEVMKRAPNMDRQAGKWKSCQVIFPHCNLTVQGTFSDHNLDSASVRFQINEEIHSWEPGKLAKAYGRLRAVWNSVAINISNACRKGSQLHQEFEAGTQRHWEVKCPGCGKLHEMRSKWDKKHPELGGLRYDADGSRMENQRYDYNTLMKTVRYQMPCGHLVPDDPKIRRKMSLGGKWSDPHNTGAQLDNESYIMDSAAVDYIPWIDIIKAKHKALRALALGDREPWHKYLAEVECIFYDDDDMPVVGKVVLNTKMKKNRAGMADRAYRFGAFDRQAGSMRLGEFPYWWAVIRDFKANGDSLLVWEGRLSSDEDAARVMVEHEVPPMAVVADSGDDTVHVYKFCLKHGYNAIKGRPEAFFSHEGGVKRIFSEERPLHAMLNCDPTKDSPEDEPLFWTYSKSGIRDRLAHLRGSKLLKWEVPGDVSEDYQKHLESEELVERRLPRTNESVKEWVQIKERNDLLVCEAYIAMLADMAGIIGAEAAEDEPEK